MARKEFERAVQIIRARYAAVTKTKEGFRAAYQKNYTWLNREGARKNWAQNEWKYLLKFNQELYVMGM